MKIYQAENGFEVEIDFCNTTVTLSVDEIEIIKNEHDVFSLKEIVSDL
jgi:hypothetical protein